MITCGATDSSGKEATGDSSAWPARKTIRLSCYLVTLALCCFSASAWAQEEDAWSFRFTPYLFLAGLNGDVAVDGHSTNVEASFSDIFENLDFGAMGTLEARKGRLGLWSDVLYTDLGADGDVPIPEARRDKFEFDSSIFMINPGVSYRLTRPGPAYVDITGGARYWHVDNNISLTGSGVATVEADQGESWVDAVVGAHLGTDFGERWFGVAEGDVGGGGADFTWQGFGALGYRFDSAGHYSAIAGYRYLHVNYENEDDGFLFDVGMHGPLVGFSFAW